MQVWEIVGGGDAGGIIVKEGEDFASPKCSSRVETGSLVKELELCGERLHYSLLSGNGPPEGWVSINLGSKPLCVRTDKQPAVATVSGFEVLLEYVELTWEPVLQLGKNPEAMVHVATEGSVIWGFPHEIEGNTWLELTEEEGTQRGAEGRLWAPVSVDLRKLGLGATLEVLALKEERSVPVPVPAEPLAKESEQAADTSTTAASATGSGDEVPSEDNFKEQQSATPPAPAEVHSELADPPAPAPAPTPTPAPPAAPASAADYPPKRVDSGGGTWGDLVDALDHDTEPNRDEGERVIVEHEKDGGAGLWGDLADLMDDADKPTWKVVAGEERGGLLVKDGPSTDSKRIKERLGVGAIVQEEEIEDGKLHFKLLEGKGPPEGWVTLVLGGAEQLVLVDRPMPGVEEEQEVAEAPNNTEAAPAAEAPWTGEEVVAEEAKERVPCPLGPGGQSFLQYGWVPPTRDELVEMLKEFVAAYSAEEFQLECRTLPDGKAGQKAKGELLWSLQRPIIGRYGFPQTPEGSMVVGECLTQPQTKADPEIAELQQEIFTLLLDPKIQDKLRKEKEERLAKEAASRETPEEIRKRQMEKERKEEALKELTKKAASGAVHVLGIPVKYKVVSESPIYEGPYFASAVVGQLTAGKFVRGYPGSRTWVKMDVVASAYDGEINPEMACWMPSANRVEGKTEVLEATWSVITLEQASTRSMKISWAGLDTPAEPFQVEYSIDWKAEALGISHDGKGLTPERSILLTNMPPDSDISIRVIAKVNASVRDVAGECVLPGPWTTFRTLPDDGEPDQLVLANQGQGEGLYEITARCALYADPSTARDELYSLRKGAKITGVPRRIGRESWLQLTEQMLPPPISKEIGPGDSYWIPLADNPVTRLEDRAAVGDNEGDEAFRVVHPRVVVRDAPSTSAQVLGFRTKGAVVKGSCEFTENGWEWLHCQYRGNSSAALQDGYMLVNGAPLGLPKLMNRGKEVTENDLLSWKASLSRPMPPRPLTVAWMAAYGGVPSLYSVREELLPASEDVGMNSQCTLVYTAPAGGGSEVGYVAKRATVKDDLATKDTAEQEYRFYAEMVYPPPGESQPPEGEPVMLAGAVRVPRCHNVNFMAAKSSEEEEDDGDSPMPKKGRNQYFLLLEMFSKPYWVSMNPANGITMDQAMAAVTSLAKMHLACQNKETMDKLSWLPLTIFDVEKHERDGEEDEEDMVSEFKRMFELNTSVLRQMLPEAAYNCAERLSRGGVEEVASALSEGDLTFCHGDYRTENLRFGAWGSPPEVGTFDFGLSCRCRGTYDLAYFVILSQPPHLRRERDLPLAWRYLEVLTDGQPTEAALGELFYHIKVGALGVLALTLLTRIAARNAGFYKETRETQTRLLRWVCIAVEDWQALDVMSDPDKAGQ